MPLNAFKKTNSKYIRLLLTLLLTCIYHFCSAQCNITFSYYASYAPNITILISDTNPGLKNYYIEYGLSGFTPGTGSTAGSGGTITTLSTTNPVGVGTSLPLSANTLYDVYVRKLCSNGAFTPNGPKQTVYTNSSCASLSTLTPLQNYTPNFLQGYGAWNFYCPGNGKEKFYKINSTNGGYAVLRTNPSVIPTTFLFNSNGGSNCDPYTFWNCIRKSDSLLLNKDSIYLWPGDNYILAKCNSINGGQSGGFSIDAPCDPGSNIVIDNITTTSFRFVGTGVAGTIIEFGAYGFTPGKGATAGAGGTIYNATGNVNFSGLLPGTNYKIYLRKLCSPGGEIYSNNIYQDVRTVECPRIVNYSTLGSTQSVLFPQGGHLAANIKYSCHGDSLNSLENFVKFTPLVSGNYLLRLDHDDWDVFTAYRENNTGTCEINNFTSLCNWTTAPNATGYTKVVGPLNAGTTYDFLLQGTAGVYNADFTVECMSPSNVSISNVQLTAATVNFNCNCSGQTIIEFGIGNFAPGTGTIVTGTSGIVLSGLLPNTLYTVYLRNSCGGPGTSQNVSTYFKTLFDCTLAPVVTCGVPFNHNQLAGDYGVWLNYTCGSPKNGKEGVFRFTPQRTANYKLSTVFLGGYRIPASVYYKEASGTCDTTGWNCLGELEALTDTVTTGLLTAGTTYILAFDQEINTGWWNTYVNRNFTIKCECTSAPSATSSMSGPAKLCNLNSASYSVPAVPDAISYSWNLPAGVNIISGATTNSIAVSFTSSFTSGTISVRAVNECGSSPAKTKSVSRNVPATPSSITGPANAACAGSTKTYFIIPILNASSYLWTVPSGVIINSGQGTTSVSITFPLNFVSGSISVKGASACGFGTARTLALRGTLNSPAVILGPASVCANQQAVTYSTGLIAGASSYQWIVPSGATITSGQTTNAIKVNYSTAGGNIKVRAINACGSSGFKILPVTIVCRDGNLHEQSIVLISPNPTKNVFNVETDFTSQENYSLVVRDVLGKIVAQYSDINSTETFSFGKDLTNGIYLVEIFNADERKILKVIKNS